MSRLSRSDERAEEQLKKLLASSREASEVAFRGGEVTF